MRRYLLFLFLFFSLNGFSFTNPNLQALLDKGEYFQFQAAFRKYSLSDQLFPPQEFLYYSAWNEHLFGNAAKSNKQIAELVNGNFNCPDSIKSELLMLYLQNDFRTFQYRSADSVSSLLLQNYSSQLKEAEISELKNFADIARGLKNTPAQRIERNGDLKIEYKRDLVNLIRVPVSMNGKEEKFIFDTGANLSTICESEAKRMGVKLLDVSFGVATSSSASVQSKLGLAAELKIGNVIFRNVVFIVLPDKALKFAGGLYKIKGIIGIPVIAQLGEVQIHKNGYLISPVKQTESDIANMGMSGNTPFVKISFYGKAHAYIFDTGAAASVLNNAFLEAYGDTLTEKKEKTSKVGGAGGVKEIKIITCTNLPYWFGGMDGTLRKGMIQLSAVSSVYDAFYGIAGEDLFMQWEIMTMNFDKGFVTVQPLIAEIKN